MKKGTNRKTRKWELLNASLLEALENRRMLSAVSFSPVQSYPVTSSRYSGVNFIATGDFNGDGKPDIVASGNTVVVLLNNGNGTFGQPQTVTSSSVGDIVVGDFNGDGKPDLAIGNNSTISTFIGNGNGTFSPGASFAAGGYNVTLVAHDMNGDGRDDLISINGGRYGVGSVDTFISNSDGTFQAGIASGVTGQIASAAVGDFNRDGKADLVLSGGAAGVVYFLAGNGDGTFKPQVSIFAGENNVDHVVRGDFNGDGNPDLAVITQTYANVEILLGNGDGTFKAPAAITAGAGNTQAIAVGDVNGDGKSDLVVADAVSFGTTTFNVLLGNGDGTFQSAQTFADGNVANVAIADFNGDNLPDLAGTANTAVNVALNQGIPFASESAGILTITGTANADSITVTDNAGSLTATMNGQSEGPFTGVTGITIGGGAGDDTISVAGVPIGATIGGAGGNDVITGGGGNDSLKGGKGNDTIGGAGGDDTLVGGGDNDSLKGGAGNDSIATGPGNDTVHGGAGNDNIIGGPGNDILSGNDGNDTIIAGAGGSQLIAGPGSDSIIGSTTAGYAADTITLTADDVVSASMADSILGQNGTDTVTFH